MTFCRDYVYLTPFYFLHIVFKPLLTDSPLVAALKPEAGLLGHSLKDSAHVDQWISYYQTEIFNVIRPIIAMISHWVPYNKGQETHYRELLPRPLGVLDKHLSTRTYLVGERITLADLEAARTLEVLYGEVVGKETREKYPHVLRHHETIVNHPLLKDIWGPTQYIDVPKAYTPPVKAKEEKPKAAKAPAAPKVSTTPSSRMAWSVV
jgi:elongation factor 1-gamma